MHSIFNGAYTDAVVCLERSYLWVFAGTCTTYYRQNASWYEVAHDPFSLPEEHQPKFHYYRFMAQLFDAIDSNRLKPAQYKDERLPRSRARTPGPPLVSPWRSMKRASIAPPRLSDP